MLQDVNLSDALFRAAVDNSYDLIVLIAQDGTFLYVNPAFSRVLGFSHRDVVGRNALEWVHPEDHPALQQELADAFLKGRGEVSAYRYRTASGAWRWFESTGAVITQGEAVPAIVVVSRDVTERRHAEEAAVHSRFNFQNVFDAIPDGIVIYENNHIVSANPALQEMLGYTLEEVVGRKIWDMIAPESHAVIRKSIDTSRTTPYEVELFRADGTRLPVEIIGRPYVNNGQMTRIVVIRDISERKRSESALKASEERFRQMAENIDEVFWMADPAISQILYVSPAYEKIWGRSCQSLYENSASFLEGIHEDDRQRVIAALGYQASENGYDIEYRVVQPDGSERRVWDRAFPVYDESGKVYRVVGIAQDITERWQAVEEQRRLIALLEAATDLVGWADASGAVQYVNPAGRRLLSLAPDEPIQGTNITDFLPDWAQEVMLGEALPAAAREGSWAGEIEFLSRDGLKIPISLVIACHTGPQGEVQFYSTIARDITESKEAEIALWKAKEELEHRVRERTQELAAINRTLQEQIVERQMAMGALQEAVAAHKQAREEADLANQEKSEFLSRMSHELRTPLNAILGFGQMLEMADLPPRRQESVRHILKAGQHLLGLINDVLDISRIEAGSMSLSLEPVPIDQAVNEVLGFLMPLAQPNNIQLYADSPSLRGRYVRADRQRLKQVLLNLTSNAIKYNRPSGSVTVSGMEAGESGSFRIAVRDTGNGLADKDLAKLFTPFERLGAARSNVEGTGIGLVLSQGLMEAMEGRIGVESTPGEGSTFWIELPLATNPLLQTQHQSGTEAGALSPAEDSLAHRKTVLYIEDNLPNLKLIEMLLEDRSDIRLLTAMQASTGLDLAMEQLPALILLDLHLPDLSGAEVLRRLRANPATAQIPVVIVSADATPGQIQRLLDAGANDYLTKPINVRQFLQAVATHLQ